MTPPNGWNLTKRPTVDAAESLLDKDIPVLDRGFVRLIDYIGGDARIVEAARVSYGAGTKTMREDRALIDYLMRNAHTSPFEQVSLVFHIKLPLFVFAQMVRHRTAKLNSLSGRYSVMEDEFYCPEADQWRGQSATNRQVGEGPIAFPHVIALWFKERCADAYQDYRSALENGVAREQARMVLPQNVYTQIYWKCDLHNLLHFLRLRLDWHAQAEIRAYAEPMYEAARAVAPMAVEAFDEHVLHGVRLSRAEAAAVRHVIASNTVTPARHVEAAASMQGLSERAARELVAKLTEAPHG